ncbi:hypothetical protein E4T47_05370 [Aureobasidium subglaciale]|nr:hypothetical protein E4T47_05370 [Aureobasidium subglaciale]
MPSIADSINNIKDQLHDQDFARQSHEQTQREHERILDEYDQDEKSNTASHTASTFPLHDSNKATSPKDTDTAFRESLFDAMADDEGAAYWQAIYGDSIHSYPRPTIQTPHGHLEEMSDDQYVSEKLSREKEGERARRHHDGEDDDEYEEDFEWVGNAEKGYEKRSTRSRRIPRPQETRESRHDAAFLSDIDAALARGAARKQTKKYHSAWSVYLQRWQTLKTSPPSLSPEALLKEIPWPVQSLVSTDVNKQNVKDFFTNAPLEDEARIKTLKDESVNWHPDRFQRRFGGGNVDEDTLKLATSVFQTIYEMWERMRPAK